MESQGVTHVGGRRIDHGGVGGRHGSAAATPLDSTVVVHGNNVLADLRTQSAPPFAQPGPQIEIGVLSPGKHADITYNLPAGTYVLLCFVADDQSGIPHALMGMHKVVTLK
ncbi:MAG: hypothetical protein WBF76_00885 [Pseudonocardiaceae bacterium]